MVSARIVTAATAATFFSMASAATTASGVKTHIETPSVTLPASTLQTVGCFKDAEPLEDYGDYKFQSPGNCQLICIMLDKPVMGLTDGTNCWCGDLIPAEKAMMDNYNECDTLCGGPGPNNDTCGGPKRWDVSLTGTTRNRIDHFVPKDDDKEKSSSSVSKSKTAEPESSTTAAQAVETETGAPEEDKKSGPNKAGIAAGVVVGVVVLAAIIVGVVLFLRHKKRREIEEEYRRRNAANPFLSGGKLHTSNSSMTDSRLDPEFMNRRQSNGSIADNEDYSRRILKVTNA